MFAPRQECSIIHSITRALVLTVLVAPAFLLTSCNLGIGVRIPGTPVSVGTSVPLKGNAPSDKIRYLDLQIDSSPSGADIYVNGILSGSTPALISIPFDKAWFGKAKGSAQIALRKPGYLSEGVRLFAVGKQISRTSGGAPIDALNLTLRPGM